MVKDEELSGGGRSWCQTGFYKLVIEMFQVYMVD